MIAPCNADSRAQPTHQNSQIRLTKNNRESTGLTAFGCSGVPFTLCGAAGRLLQDMTALFQLRYAHITGLVTTPILLFPIE